MQKRVFEKERRAAGLEATVSDSDVEDSDEAQHISVDGVSDALVKISLAVSDSSDVKLALEVCLRRNSCNL